MCPDPNQIDLETDKKQTPPQENGCMGPRFTGNAILVLLTILAVCAITMVAELGSLVSLVSSSSQEGAVVANPATDGSSTDSVDPETSGNLPSIIPGENVCEGKSPDLPSVDCIIDSLTNVGPQSGANVTEGYQGELDVDSDPLTTPFYLNGMCAVNVHWHLGAEHLSVGEYDELGKGPETGYGDDEDGPRPGHRCRLYDPEDPKFTTPYEWKYCKDMQVGQTYEVHWPHSAAGACGTPNQFQTPFPDGVFCVDGILNDTAKQIGVQAQVFVVVNDDSYFWPDLMSGMIVEGEMGTDMAKYTGSTTGDKINNEVCSQYSPITWQVDRKCHMLSASAFDRLCHDMLQQRDDMSADVHPHGSRETVSDELAANNQNRFLRRI